VIAHEGVPNLRRWLSRLSLVILLFAGGACSSSCRGCGKSSAGGGADAAPGDPRVELINQGREPRAKLEVERPTGFSYVSELESESSFGIQGQVPTVLPTAIARMKSEVIRGMGNPVVRQRGFTELRLIEERATLEKLAVRSSALPPDFVAQFNVGLNALTGTTTRALVAVDGEVVEMKTELVGGKKPPPEIAFVLDTTWEAQRRFPFRLPADPVGPGARWRFSESLEFRKVRGLQLAEMYLLTLDDHSARIRVKIRHQCPRQEVPHPLNPKDTAMLEHYRGDADGEVTIDRATAILLDGRLATTATLRMSGSVDGSQATVTFVAASLLRVHGDVVREEAAAGDGGEPVTDAQAADR
jgi:hypothetical protein